MSAKARIRLQPILAGGEPDGKSITVKRSACEADDVPFVVTGLLGRLQG